MSRAYFNQMAVIWDEAVTEQDKTKLRLMSERLDIAPGARVLDAGTGTGVFIPFLLKKIGGNGQIVALDVAREMLAKAVAKEFNGNIYYLNADVNFMPFPGETFDSVVCYSSFPHFQDKLKALIEIIRVTRSGGSLFICHTSSRADINGIHCSIPDLANDIIPDGDGMQKILSEAGFAGINIEDLSESYLCRATKP